MIDQATRELGRKIVDEAILMRRILQEIATTPEPKPRGHRQPDDEDWRFVALEMKRLALIALGTLSSQKQD
jgi:hypothetical protein